MIKFFRLFLNWLFKETEKEPKYRVFHDLYGGGYAVVTEEEHIEYFDSRREACVLRDELNNVKEYF